MPSKDCICCIWFSLPSPFLCCQSLLLFLHVTPYWQPSLTLTIVHLCCNSLQLSIFLPNTKILHDHCFHWHTLVSFVEMQWPSELGVRIHRCCKIVVSIPKPGVVSVYFTKLSRAPRGSNREWGWGSGAKPAVIFCQKCLSLFSFLLASSSSSPATN